MYRHSPTPFAFAIHEISWRRQISQADFAGMLAYGKSAGRSPFRIRADAPPCFQQ
jgi:hypothetical protein